MLKRSLIAAAISSVFLVGCQTPATTQDTTAEVVKQQSESERANAFFEEVFMRGVMRSPVYQTYMGIKKDYDKWDDGSEARALEDLALAKKTLKRCALLTAAS